VRREALAQSSVAARQATAHAAISLTGKRGLAYNGPVDADPVVFKAIGDATRRTILDELIDKDGQTLFEICGRLTMKHGLTVSRQAISQHLAVLEQAGLVHTRRQGRYKFHHIDTIPLRSIVERWSIDREEPNP
jgi:DNA-binding transcriptional ArsR family regulator